MRWRMGQPVCRPSLAIRPLTPDDWPQWRALRLAALRESPAAFGSTLAEWQGVGDHPRRWRARLEGVALNLVAELDGRAVGMGSGSWRSFGLVELISFWVAPQARGVGVGDWLIEHVARWAEGQGAAELVLKVYVSNARALAAYRRNGFVQAGRVAARSAGREDEWRMVRPLAKREAPLSPRTGGPTGTGSDRSATSSSSAATN